MSSMCNFFLCEQLFVMMKVFALLSLLFGVAIPLWHTCAQTQMGHVVASDVINQHLSYSLYEAIGCYRLIFTRLYGS